MKLWPPWPEMLWMLTMLPATRSRRMILAASCIRKNGARTLTAKIAVEQFGRGVEDGAAVSDRGDVDQHVQRAEARVGARDHVPRILHARQIGVHVFGRAAGGGQFARHPLAVRRIAPADHQPGRAAPGEQPRHRLAQPLRAAGDDGDLALHGSLPQSAMVKPARVNAAARCCRPFSAYS